MIRNSDMAERLERLARRKAQSKKREVQAQQQQDPYQRPRTPSDAEAADEIEKAIAHLQKHRSDQLLSNEEAEEIRKLKPGSPETAQQEVLARIFQRLREMATAPTTSTHKRHVIERAEAVIKYYRQTQSRNRVERQRIRASAQHQPSGTQINHDQIAEQRAAQARTSKQVRKTLDEQEQTSRSDSHERRPSPAQVAEQQRRHDMSHVLRQRQAGAAERRRRNYQGQSTSPGSRKSFDIDLKTIADFLSSAPEEMQNRYVEAVRKANQFEKQLEQDPNAAKQLDALAPDLLAPVLYSQQQRATGGNPQHRVGQTPQLLVPIPPSPPGTPILAPRSQPQSPPSRFYPQPQASKPQSRTSAPPSPSQPQASASQISKSQARGIRSQMRRVERSSRNLSELFAAAALCVETEAQRQQPQPQSASRQGTWNSHGATHPAPHGGQAELGVAPAAERSGQVGQGPQFGPLRPSAMKELTIVLASLKSLDIVSLVEAEIIRNTQDVDTASAVKDLIEEVIKKTEDSARKAECHGLDSSHLRDMIVFLEHHLFTRYRRE